MKSSHNGTRIRAALPAQARAFHNFVNASRASNSGSADDSRGSPGVADRHRLNAGGDVSNALPEVASEERRHTDGESHYLDRMEVMLREMLHSAKAREHELRASRAVYSVSNIVAQTLKAEVEERENTVREAEKVLELRERLLKERQSLQTKRREALLRKGTELGEMKACLDARIGAILASHPG